MTIIIALNRTTISPSPHLADPQRRGLVDDVRGLLDDICERIAMRQLFSFCVSGFGDTSWPVDIRTDLSVFLEQLPHVIDAIERKVPKFSLDFYEQGVERCLWFTRLGNTYKVRCQSMTEWRPQPEEETIGKHELYEMLVSIKTEFLRAASLVAPELMKYSLLKAWAASM